MMLRRAVASDAKPLFALESRVFSEENYPLSVWSFYYHIRKNLLFVAYDEEGELAGYVLALVKREKAKLYSLGIDEEHRGLGIAKMLLENILTELRNLGFKSVLLEVREDNEKAIDLYLKFGFVEMKKQKQFYKDGCTAFVMEKSLENSDKCLT